MNATEAAVATPLGPHEVLVAGQAKARDLTRVGNNTGEFHRVAGLWVKGRTG